MYRVAGWGNNAGSRWTYNRVCHIVRLLQRSQNIGDFAMEKVMRHMLMSYLLNEPQIAFAALEGVQ
jgi:hypothetical protein